MPAGIWIERSTLWLALVRDGLNFQHVKVVLITPDGEQGPFTPAQINRMHSEGKLKADQPCCVDGTNETKPLSEVFRHLAADKAVAVREREKVRVYVEKERSRAALIGGILAFVGGVFVLISGRVIRGSVLLVGGIILFSREYLKQAPVRQTEAGEGPKQEPECGESTYDY
jgi:hypothetical protein